MNTYHKIQSVFMRDMDNKKRLLLGEWSRPEFKYLADNEWEFTEKVDGTNVRIMWDGTKMSLGGKTDDAMLPARLVDYLYSHFLDGSRFRDVFPHTDLSLAPPAICLYGEGCGPGIQKGRKYGQQQYFVLFDVLVGTWWLRRADVEDVAAKLELAVVPVVGTGTLWQGINRVRDDGLRSHWGDFFAEGIVARPAVELFTRGGERIITKWKHKDFLA